MKAGVLLACGICAVCAVGLAHAQTAQYSSDAVAHRAAVYKPEEFYNVYYLTYHAYADGPLRQDLRNVAAFVLASSSSQEIVEYCTPQPVMLTDAQGEQFASGELGLIHLKFMQWDYKQWCEVLKKYPYKTYYGTNHPLVVRADWLIAQLADPTVSDAHYRLLYNNANLTRDQFIAFWGGNKDVNFHYGIPEAQSGVSVQKKRWLLNIGTNRRTYLWQTLDFLKIDKKTDPLGNLLYPIVDRFKAQVHNGEELIAGMPKFSIRTNNVGALQAYLLSDQNGKRVEEAPGTLVRTDNSFRGYGAITNFGGCINCHKTGINLPVSNDYIGYLAIDPNTGDFATAKAEYHVKLQIDKFNLRSPAQDIKNDNSLYTSGVLMCNGLTTIQNVQAFQRVFKAYDAPVTLQQAAHELSYDMAELRLAMAWHNANYKYDPTDPLSVNPRFSDLGKGRAIPRSTWEDIYTYTAVTLKRWVEATKGKLP